MTNFLIFNTQSAGDAILGTHLARLIKEQIPNSVIVFAVRSDMTLTTAENNPLALGEVLDIIELQYGIDHIGVVSNGRLLLKSGNFTHFDHEYMQCEWFSDLGLVQSQLTHPNGPKLILNTDTKFNIGSEKILTNIPTIGVAGLLDWNRKWQNHEEIKKLLAYLNSQLYIKIETFGRDVSADTYLQQAKRLNNCDLLISPIGSLVHLAAGLEVDTISLTSVFPSSYDAPEFYHSGYHRSIKCLPKLHCGTYKCITEKNYAPFGEGWGNPPTSMGFWPKDCPYTVNGKSCVVNVTADQIISEFETWLKKFLLQKNN